MIFPVVGGVVEVAMSLARELMERSRISLPLQGREG